MHAEGIRNTCDGRRSADSAYNELLQVTIVNRALNCSTDPLGWISPSNPSKHNHISVSSVPSTKGTSHIQFWGGRDQSMPAVMIPLSRNSLKTDIKLSNNRIQYWFFWYLSAYDAVIGERQTPDSFVDLVELNRVGFVRVVLEESW